MGRSVLPLLIWFGLGHCGFGSPLLMANTDMVVDTVVACTRLELVTLEWVLAFYLVSFEPIVFVVCLLK